MATGTQHQFLNDGATATVLDRRMIDGASGESVTAGAVSNRSVPLTYSSPRPWILAIGISCALWGGIIYVLKTVLF